MRAGWPAVEEVDFDGWVARYAHGVTQRANSVLPVGAPADPVGVLARVEAWYAERGLPAVFQLSAGSELDGLLAARGYAAGSPTGIQTVGVADALRRLGRHEVEVATTAGSGWFDLWWSVDGRGDGAARVVAEKILGGGPAVYATIADSRGAAAVGRLALVGEWGGVYCLAVRPDVRGRGLGARVLSGLLAAGRDRGVTRSWLQVRAENSTARRLYERAGFVEVAGYHYRSAGGQEPVEDVDAEP